MSVLETLPLKYAPNNAVGVSVSANATPWLYGSWVQLLSAAPAGMAIAGIFAPGDADPDLEFQIGVGAASFEVGIGHFRQSRPAGHTGTHDRAVFIPVPLSGVSTGNRVSVRARKSGLGGGTFFVTLAYYEGYSGDTLADIGSVPAGADGVTLTPSATPWAYTSYVELTPGVADNKVIYGLTFSDERTGTLAQCQMEYDLAIGAAGSETIIKNIRVSKTQKGSDSHFILPRVYPLFPNTRVAVRLRKSDADTTAIKVSLLWYEDQLDGNLPPVVNAGSPQTITLPTNTAVLTGSATDDGLPAPPGAIQAWQWTKVSGPGNVAFADDEDPTTTATFTPNAGGSIAGTYVLRLGAYDGEFWGYAPVTITVSLGAITTPILTIGGVNTPFLVETLSITAAVSSRDVLEVQIDNPDINAVPPQNAEVIVEIEGVRKFGGILNAPQYRGFGGIGWAQINTQIRAVDFNGYADRRVVDQNVPSGFALDVLTNITTSSIANPTVITTQQPHGLSSGTNVVIEGHQILTWPGSKSYAFLRTTGNFSNGDTVTLGVKVYTFQTTLVNSADNVLIGASAADSLGNLVLAIMAGAGAGTLYGTGTTANPVADAYVAGNGDLVAQYLTVGVAGNTTPVATTSATADWIGEGAVPTSTLNLGSDAIGGAGGDSPLNGGYVATVTGPNTLTVPFNNTDPGYGGTIRPAFNLKEILEDLIATYLVPFGITLDPSQADGPAVAGLTASYKTAAQVLNHYSELTGWIWQIDYFKVLRMWEPGDIPAPFDIEDDDGNVLNKFDMTVEYEEDYGNAIILLAGGEGPGEIVYDEIIADGVPGSGLRQYQFRYLAYDNIDDTWPNLLYFNGVNVHTVRWGMPDATFAWGWDWRTNSLWHDQDTDFNPITAVPAAGTIISVGYRSRYPIVVRRSDGAEIIANGQFDRVIRDDAIKAIDIANVRADEELLNAVEQPRTVRFTSEIPGLHPGQVIHINSVIRGIDADFLITEVVTTNDESNAVRYRITAVEGTQFRGTWRDIFKNWNG